MRDRGRSLDRLRGADRAMDRRRALGIGLVVVAGASFGSGSIFATLSLRRGARLADAARLAVPDRGRPRLAVGRCVARRVARSVRRAVAPAARGDARAGRPLHRQRRDVLRGLETIPASLAGVIVYIYPVVVAVLSLRFATRLPGRRPWFALRARA